MEARLAELAIPISRLIAAAGIGRSTWADWRAGRTRPRTDRWTAATTAFDALVAEATLAPVTAQAQPVRLTGSSAPTGMLPAFVPLFTTSVATPTGGLDAEVIDLAARVAALAVRENKASGWVGTIEDHIAFKGPQPSTRNYEATVRALRARFDLVRVEKRRHRMFLRLVRWATRLTAMQPVTRAGLKAKAEAQLAVDRAGNFDDWTQNLASSVGRDAIRIIEASSDARLADESRDGELMALGRAWQDCADRLERASKARSEAEDRMVLAEWPETLCFNPETDPPVIAAKAQQHADTDQLRYFYPMVERLRGEWPHDASRARRDEILAAYDARMLQIEEAEEAAGLKAARRALAPIVAENGALRRRILAIPASTPGGVAVKVAVACWCLGDIAGMEEDLARYMEDGDAGDDALVCGALLDVVRVMGGGQRATIDTLYPVLMPAEIASPLCPAGASSDVVESYRTFLDMELRFLNQEVHGSGDASRHYRLDTPAGRMHSGQHEPATSRAAAVLGLLGLMPGTGDTTLRSIASAA